MDSSSDTGSDSSHLLNPGTEKEYGFQRPRQNFLARHRKLLLWSGFSILAALIVIIIYVSTSMRLRSDSFVPNSKQSDTTFADICPGIDWIRSAMGPSPLQTR